MPAKRLLDWALSYGEKPNSGHFQSNLSISNLLNSSQEELEVLPRTCRPRPKAIPDFAFHESSRWSSRRNSAKSCSNGRRQLLRRASSFWRFMQTLASFPGSSNNLSLDKSILRIQRNRLTWTRQIPLILLVDPNWFGIVIFVCADKGSDNQFSEKLNCLSSIIWPWPALPWDVGWIELTLVRSSSSLLLSVSIEHVIWGVPEELHQPVCSTTDRNRLSVKGLRNMRNASCSWTWSALPPWCRPCPEIACCCSRCLDYASSCSSWQIVVSPGWQLKE